MLKYIVTASLSRRAMVLFALMMFAFAGIVAFKKLNIEAYPNPAPVILEITAQAPGLSAEEMERYYTVPMEIALYSTPGIDTIRSTSFYGLSFVRVTFKYGVDLNFAYAQTSVALQQNVSLPGNQIPQINQSSEVGEIYRYTLQAPPHFGLTNLRTVQDWIVLRRLSTIHGIVNINSWGGTTKQFNIDIDPRKLEAYSVTMSQILTALANANINVGGREIRIGQQSINIRGIGLIDDGGNDNLVDGYKVGDIEKVVLTQTNGVPVQIKDVGKVSVGYVPRLGIFGRDYDDDVVAAIVVMGQNQKTDEMLPKVQEEMTKMNSDGSLPPGVKVVPFYDRSELMHLTTHTVLHNLVFGCVLVFLIQWIFLGNLRSAIIVGVNIPFALFFAVMMLVMQGESGNLLSIGAIDFGIIVDSAVILVENIFRKFEAKDDLREQRLEALSNEAWGEDPTTGPEWTDRLRLILISSLQVDKAIFFSTLITVAAFVPLFTMQGVEGQIFGPMARTYGYALAGALIATFTVSPVLASFLLPETVSDVETIVVRGLRKIYTPVLRLALKHRRQMALFGFVFLVICGFLATKLGTEFLPALEENNFWIRASMPATLSLEAGEAATRKMRLILLKYPEVKTVTSQHGRPDNGTDASPFSNVELFVPLKPPEEWPAGVTKEELTAKIQKEFEDALPGVVFNFSQYIQDNIEEAISGVKGANSVKIFGPNLTELEKLAAEVRDQMSQVKGVSDLGIFPVLGQPNLNIKVDRMRAARYGLNTGDVNTVIQAALGGTNATTILEGDRSWNLVVRYAPEDRDSIEKIKNIKVGYTSGNTTAYIPLSELATITLDTGAAWIYREAAQRYIPVKFSVSGRDLGSTVAEAQARIAKNIHLPAGYHLSWAGEFEDLRQAQERLAIIVPLSLVLIIGLLYCLFNSLHDSLLVLMGIPFAIAGGIIGLLVTGMDFSISAAVGFISLFGVSVMNGILLMTYYNEVRKGGGISAQDAMFYAAGRQMRPMLMMALSACIGLLPAALSTGIGSQVQRPLAVVVVGGMLIGPAMLLVVVPALQLLFTREKNSLRPDNDSSKTNLVH